MFINNAKKMGLLQGLRINDNLYLTHLLFVDDVLIFLNGTRQDSIQFDLLLNWFCRATGMAPNSTKSSIIVMGC